MLAAAGDDNAPVQSTSSTDGFAEVPGLPRVLLIGDSIAIGYTAQTRALLRGQANVYRIPVNGGSTELGLQEIDQWLGADPWDVIHFNWGLHDITILEGQREVALDDYKANLATLTDRLVETGAELIWATTTPVPAGQTLDPPRNAGDEVAYNNAALPIMRDHDIGINDLYSHVVDRLAEVQLPADVHFTPAGYAVLADRVATKILQADVQFVSCLEVTNTDDSGLGSLRFAIDCANLLEGPDTITFDIPGDGPHTIAPQSPLPPIRDRVVIDATTEPGFQGTPLVELDGSAAGAGASGFEIRASAAESIVRGLAINRFDRHGVFISRSDSNRIENNYIGADPTGTLDLGNGQAGVYVINGAGNAITDNLISANDVGVLVKGANSTGNVISANRIGTDADARTALGSQIVGVEIAAAPHTTVGGPAAANANVISGNRYGISIRGEAATDNMVQSNFIGTNADGTLPIQNKRGVFVQDAVGNTIGGAGISGNLISGNREAGVYILRGQSNVIGGNQIGTDLDGETPLPNTRGIVIRDGADNTIGSPRNIISGNIREGVKILGAAARGNVIRENFIGTSRKGREPLPNRTGVWISSQASQNLVGGAAAEMGNVISGNRDAGVYLSADDNVVQGNLIGTSLAGNSAVPNETGILIDKGANNTIGGTAAGAGNVISGNLQQGILIRRDTSTGNKVEGNLIGVVAAGTRALPNKEGVMISAPGNTIGGAADGAGNVISGNDRNGVYLKGVEAAGNVVAGNLIGANKTGKRIVPNKVGVLIEDAPSNTIGGTSGGSGNLIVGNRFQGVKITGPAATGNTLAGNSIGVNSATGDDLPNHEGVRIADGASGNTIGGGQPGAANEIAFNDGRGVWISEGTANRVSRNSIHDNGALGLDLGAIGPSSNSSDQDDSGANNSQPFPTIEYALLNESRLEIKYSVFRRTMNSQSPITVEFFLADAAGEEGQTFLGRDIYTEPNKATALIPVGDDVRAGSRIVATATDALGNTSEFTPAELIDAVFAEFAS